MILRLILIRLSLCKPSGMLPSMLRFRVLSVVCVVIGVCTLAVGVSESISAAPRLSSRRPFHRHRVRKNPPPPDPAAVTLGERLFLETRFAQFFAEFVNGGGGVNDALPSGDPTVEFTVTTAAPLPGPFAGTSINCRSCHLVDEQVGLPDGGMRTYSDFAARSPISPRVDGLTTAPRNSPPLVNASLPRDVGLLLHFDGEFDALPDLVRSTLTGRNFGWLPRESTDAIAHIARIIRRDDGQGPLAQEFGGLSYRVVLAGKDPSIPDDMKISKRFRVDVARATNRQIFDAVAELISAYTEQLVFSTDGNGNFNLSPFDVFLEQNGLPRQAAKGETHIEYSRRLLKRIVQIEGSGALQFVSSNPNTPNGQFEFHPNQAFTFGADELLGLKIFFSEPKNVPLSPSEITAGSLGNCIACHAAPTFTDFRLHNTGASQVEYDAIHGATTFAQLAVPGLGQRLAHHDQYLPPTPQHPDASGVFRAVPDASAPQLTDLGVWNVFANPDFPKPQPRLRQILCDAEFGTRVPPFLVQFLGRCSFSALLPKTIALFKTPGLRDLNHSGPYMHNGQFELLGDVIELYRTTSALERAQALRNGDAELAGIALRVQDVAPLVAFLRSLNEDYQ